MGGGTEESETQTEPVTQPTFSSQGALVVILPMQEMGVQSLGREDPLEKGMVPHSRILAWRVPRTEEPDRLQWRESQRVGHD